MGRLKGWVGRVGDERALSLPPSLFFLHAYESLDPFLTLTLHRPFMTLSLRSSSDLPSSPDSLLSTSTSRSTSLSSRSSSSSNALSLLQARIQAIEMAQKATLQQRKTHETALVKSLKIVQNKNNASNNNSNNGSYDREIGAGGGSRDLMGRSGGEGSGTVGNPRGGGERELRSKDSNSSMKNATAESDTMDWEEGKGGGGKKK